MGGTLQLVAAIEGINDGHAILGGGAGVGRGRVGEGGVERG